MVPAWAQSTAVTDANAFVQKIQAELSSNVSPPEATPDPAIPQGKFVSGTVHSTVYPGMDGDFQVYVPAQYDPAKPACLLVKLDGFGGVHATILDQLIAKKDIPITIAVGISPGMIWKDPVGTPNRRGLRYNRSFEFDSVNGDFAKFILDEVIPAVEKMSMPDGRPIKISKDGNDHMAMGASSGGIGAFALAWNRPDQFTRVYSEIGTFVSMRGGHDFHELIRKTDPKPIRVFLEDGSTDAWNPLFGSWYEENLAMESALSFSGYDVAHAWGVHGHDGQPGDRIFPDVMRWMWRDYPARITAGHTRNDAVSQITLNQPGWETVAQTFQGATGLAANAQGQVFVSDATAGMIYRLGADDKAQPFGTHGPGIVAEVFGPDGTLYGIDPSEKKILAFDAQGVSRTFVDGIVGHGITLNHQGVLYVSEQGEHAEIASRIWQIKPTGEKKVVDEGLLPASGVALQPDGVLFYAAEPTSRWVYSYVVQPDGTLADRQRFYWLHTDDITANSGAEDMALDTQGFLYVATRTGIQVGDLRGGVRAILPLPTPCGPVRSLCFGGEKFETLYATDGVRLFKRHVGVSGFLPSAASIPMPAPGGP